MNRKQFIYRRFWIVMLWAILIYIPFVFFIPDLFEKVDGILYYILNILLTIATLFVFWRLADYLPGIKRTGCYYREDGRTVIEYRREKIEFLSEAMYKDTDIETTIYYDIFTHILEENPQLEIEKDIWGEDIDWWYKAGKNQ